MTNCLALKKLSLLFFQTCVWSTRPLEKNQTQIFRRPKNNQLALGQKFEIYGTISDVADDRLIHPYWDGLTFARST